MTPLAHEIMKRRLRNETDRVFHETEPGVFAPGGFPDPLKLLVDAHYFEVSQIIGTVYELADKILRSGDPKLAFLPAPHVWIEYRVPNTSGRVAIRLRQKEDNPYASVEIFVHHNDGGIVYRVIYCFIPLYGSTDFGVSFKPMTNRPHDQLSMIAANIYGILAMINSPRIIGRTQHQPHAGMQRAIAKTKALVGSFPLKAWTELRLEVRLPKDETNSKARETILSGSRALHFVRRHIRIRRGRLEIVSPHWRGDPALGIKRTRYAVVPPKDGKWPQLTHHSEGVPE